MQDESVSRLAALDPVLGQLMERVGPLDVTPRRLPPFQSLTRAIIYQQLSGTVADAILNRFVALFPGKRFPTPAQVVAASPEQLRSAGLSRPKAKYIQGIAEQAVAGALPTLAEADRLSDDALIERLTQLKGVGRWTVEMFLIFNLGRPDVLPVHDLGVRRGYQLLYGKRKLPEPEALERFGTRWKPFRTTAARYLWRAVDLRTP